MRGGTAQAQSLVVVPPGVSADTLFMRSQKVLHFLYAHLLGVNGGVRELLGIGDVLSENLLPREVVAREVVVGGTAFGRSQGRAEVKVLVDAGLSGLIAPVFNGALNHAGRKNHVFRIRGIELIHHEVVRDIDNFIVLHAAGGPGVALVDGDLPGFVGVRDRIGAAFGEIAVGREKVNGDVNGVTGACGALSHQAPDTVTDTAVFDRHDVVLVDPGAGV